jgi:hypothetical protein
VCVWCTTAWGFRLVISAEVKLPLFSWVQHTIVSLSSLIGSFSAALLAGIPLSANEIKYQHVLTSSVVSGGLPRSFQTLLSAATAQGDSEFQNDGFSMLVKCTSTKILQSHWPSPRVRAFVVVVVVEPWNLCALWYFSLWTRLPCAFGLPL